MNSIFLQTHYQREKLTVSNPLYKAWVLLYTLDELEKDLCGGSDITTETLFSIDQPQTGFLLAKQPGILAGVQELEFFLAHTTLKAEFSKKDGDFLKGTPQNPEKIAKLSGNIKDLMKSERVFLNLLGRMSGVATYTRKFADKAQEINPNVLITPTRKTLWGWLDKRACVLGGGGTHRLSISDAILIKHNHIRAFGSDLKLPLRKVLSATIETGINSPLFVEIEVNTGYYGVAAARIMSDCKKKGYPLPCFVMFDNVLASEISKALETIRRGLPSGELAEGVFFEASGGITLENIQDYAKTGVDIISIGALTGSAPMLDFSFRTR